MVYIKVKAFLLLAHGAGNLQHCVSGMCVCVRGNNMLEKLFYGFLCVDQKNLKKRKKLMCVGMKKNYFLNGFRINLIGKAIRMKNFESQRNGHH